MQTSHNPFKQLDFHADDRKREAEEKAKKEGPVSTEFPKHVNFPDGSYRVANNAKEEAAILAMIDSPEGKKKK